MAFSLAALSDSRCSSDIIPSFSSILQLSNKWFRSVISLALRRSYFCNLF